MTDITELMARLKKRFVNASDSDRQYERPMNWIEADLLMNAIERLTRERDGARQWVEDVKNVQENANAEGYAEAKAHYEARVVELEAALKDIARQKLVAEMDDPDMGCFEEGYEACILNARRRIGGQP